MAENANTDPAVVEAFVGAAHGDLDRVTEMLTEDKELANATWDWGGGDWETALGAAAHMGRRDIAEHLMAHGARMDVFAAAMLGELDVVKAILVANPSACDFPGPHGISLLDHAESGGDAAVSVVEHLQTLARG